MLPFCRHLKRFSCTLMFLRTTPVRGARIGGAGTEGARFEYESNHKLTGVGAMVDTRWTRLLSSPTLSGCPPLLQAGARLRAQAKVYALQRVVLPVSGLASWLLVAAGGLMTLHVVGINIAPLLTVGGVSGIIVGLSAQSVMSNMISGINLVRSDCIFRGCPGSFCWRLLVHTPTAQSRH